MPQLKRQSHRSTSAETPECYFQHPAENRHACVQYSSLYSVIFSSRRTIYSAVLMPKTSIGRVHSPSVSVSQKSVNVSSQHQYAGALQNCVFAYAQKILMASSYHKPCEYAHQRNADNIHRMNENNTSVIFQNAAPRGCLGNRAYFRPTLQIFSSVSKLRSQAENAEHGAKRTG